MGKIIQIDGAQMRALGEIIKENLPEGLGFAVLTFETGDSKIPANYLSNCDRKDMIKFLRETADRIEKNQDNDTHELGKQIMCSQCFQHFPDSLALRSVGCPSCGGVLMSS